MSLEEIEIILISLLCLSELLPFITKVPPNGLLHSVLCFIKTVRDTIREAKENAKIKREREQAENQQQQIEDSERILAEEKQKQEKIQRLENKLFRLDQEKKDMLIRLQHQTDQDVKRPDQATTISGREEWHGDSTDRILRSNKRKVGFREINSLGQFT